MTARAESVRATADAILDAATTAFTERSFDQVTLNDIAAHSGVTVQTVIRRFGSKEELFKAIAEREGARIRADREVSTDAGLSAALSILLDHYEADGDVVLHLLAQERTVPLVGAAVEEGRQVHRAWIEQHCWEVFDGTTGDLRERLINAAIAATDLGTWKLLRRDLLLNRDEVAAVMLQLIEGLITRRGNS